MLAGHRREITAMFCDLRNFTTFSETAEPEEVLGFLRRYHATVGGLVVEHEGTLEHFAGDGLMVFFNDPELQADHAARAVRLAVAIRERFVEISEEWRRRGHVLRSGIGIATGYATMGRIGFEGRYDYGGDRQRDHPRLAAERRGRGRRDPDLAADVRRGRRGGRGGARRRAPAQGLQPADAGLSRPQSGRPSARPRCPDRWPPRSTQRRSPNLLEMTGGDQAFVDELIDTYLEEGERLVEALARRRPRRAADDLVRPAHSLKSSSLNVGALELGELCRSLEEEARGGGVADPVGRADAISAAFAEARTALLEERAQR